jgi:uncharacterized protein (TIGR02145 family)
MKFFSTIFILFFFEFAMGQIPGTPNLSSQLQKPSVYTLSYTFPNLTTANITAQVINSRQNRIIECGILWGSSIPTIDNYLGLTTDGLKNGRSFISSATSLPFDVDTIYFVAYATTSKGTQYGKVLTLPRTVQSPYTGKVWMTSNLGATTTPVSPSPTPDVPSYGNLYQWGRTSDGHEIAQPTKSAQTTNLAADYTNTTSSFITNSSGNQDWLTSENPNLWQGISGLNNPCPNGYRLPTLNEFSNEIMNFSSQDISGAFNSFLKLPVTGSRDNAGNVIGYTTHDIGRYWTSTINGSNSRPIYLTASSITQPTDLSSSARVNGFAIRCIRGEISSGGSAIVTAYTLGTSAGTMTASVPVSAVTQNITATVSQTGNYNIAAIANGVKFSAKGIFLQTGDQNIELTASGTPELGTPPGSSISYTLNTLPNTTFTRTVEGWSTNGTAEVSAYTPISSSGTLFAGVSVSEVTQTFSANVITPGSYNITAINNGVTYKARGTFTGIGNQNFDLTASGTPISIGTYTFTSNTTPSATFTRTIIHRSTNGTAVVSEYSPSSSTGTMLVGVRVSGVTQIITANVTTVGTYTITTNSANGVRFAASGTFTNTGPQTVTLIASGTPITTGTFTFISNTTPGITYTRKIISTSTNGTSVITSINSSAINGTMFIGVPITEGSVFLRISVNTSVAGDYDISTAPFNGITFSGIGNLIAGNNQTLDLFASGIPTNTGSYNFSTNTSSPNISFWTTDIISPSTNGTGIVSSYALKSSSGTLYRGAYEEGNNKQIITANVTSGYVYNPSNALSFNSYNITTDNVNGITFAGSGESMGNQGLRDITLTATGTPIATGTFTYITNTNPSVTFTRTTVYTQPSSNGTAVIRESIISANPVAPSENLATGVTSGVLIPTSEFDVIHRYIFDVTTPGTFSLSTSANGITLRKNGTLVAGGNVVDLRAQGTPSIAGTHTFTLNISEVSGPISLNSIIRVHPSTNGNGHISTINSSTSAGRMTRGIPVSEVTQTFNVTVTRLGSYNITNTVDGVTFSASGIFTITGNQDIVFTASGTPTSSGSKNFTLNISSVTGNRTFNRTVNDPDLSSNGSAIVSSYSIGSSAGTMTVGVPVSEVTQTITANVSDVGTYNLSTSANGVTFSAIGTLSAIGNQNITLTASGTPTAIGSNNFDLNTNPGGSFTRTTVVNPSSGGTANFSLISSPGSSTGTLTAGVLITGTGIYQQIPVTVSSGGSWSITTNTVNGVTFSNSGSSISTSATFIRLFASGTPTETGNFTFIANNTPSITFNRDFLINPTSNGTAEVASYTNATSTGNLRNNIIPSDVTQTLTANVTTAGTWNINTGSAANNVIFAGSGTFTGTGNQPITLTASGTPSGNSPAGLTFTLNTSKVGTFTRSITEISSNGNATISEYTLGSSAGVIQVGNAVAAGTVTQVIQAYVTSAGITRTVNISTNTVNGITFRSGSVAVGGSTSFPGTRNISLTATGTPTAVSESAVFIINTTPSLTFTRTIGEPTTNGTAVISSFTIGSSLGTMKRGTPVNGVSQTINVNVTTLGTYNISAIKNGVTFTASGTFTTYGNQDIVLIASGTPTTLVTNGTGANATFVTNTIPTMTFYKTTPN